MLKFSKKIMKYTLGYSLYMISFLVPKKKNLWLYGNMHGFYDNSKYLFLSQLADNEVESYWISRDKNLVNILKSKKIPAEYTFSPAGIWLALRAKVYIYSYNLDDINVWTSPNKIKVNLWHGVGIKKIQGQITIGNSAKNFKYSLLKRIKSPQNFIVPDLFLSTSPLMNTHFAKSFNLPLDRIIEANYPRCEILSKGKSEIIDIINTIEPYSELYNAVKDVKKFSKSYLYMPTWRDSGKSNLDVLDLDKLNEYLLLENKILYLKLHPNEVIQKMDNATYSNIQFISKKIDIYLVLPFIDVLITDYSSIYYDFILMEGKEVILFPYDYNEYLISERDLAFDYEQYTPGIRVFNQNELMSTMKLNNKNSDQSLIKNTFWSGNNSSQHIVYSIKKLQDENK